MTHIITLVLALGAIFALHFGLRRADRKMQTAVLAIPILLISLGYVKKDPKCILSTVTITMACNTAIHFANVAINAYCAANQVLNSAGEIIVVNYMYSIFPDNPLVALFQQIIPGTYWHMYLAAPIVVVYLLAVYAPELFKGKK